VAEPPSAALVQVAWHAWSAGDRGSSGLAGGPGPVVEPPGEVVEGRSLIPVLEWRDLVVVKDAERYEHAVLEGLGQHLGQDFAVVLPHGRQQHVDAALVWKAIQGGVGVGIPCPGPGPAGAGLALAFAALPG